MTNGEKITMVNALLGSLETSENARISVYLEMAEREILGWRYSYASDMPETVPPEYEMTQVNAVVAGYSIRGAENQTVHSENGISRTFKYEDMISYIRSHVIAIAKVI